MSELDSIDFREKIVILLFDMALLVLAFIVADLIVASFNPAQPWLVSSASNGFGTIVPFVIFPVMIYIFELYQFDRWKQNIRLIILLSSAMGVGAGLMAISGFVFPEVLSVERKTLLLHLLLSTAFLFFNRKIALKRPMAAGDGQKIIMIGAHELIGEIYELLQKDYSHRYSTLCWIKPSRQSTEGSLFVDPETEESLSSLVKKNHYSTVVISDDLSVHPEINRLIPILRLTGAKVYDPFNFYESMTHKVPVNHIGNKWFLFHNQGVSFNPRFYLKIKKVVEKLIALCLLVILLPILTIISLSILIFDGSPILFLQERMGLKGKKFTLYKFRSMQAISFSTFVPAWEQTNIKQNAVTRLGCFLRKTRLDELPQLINVLRGEMSFIGPRPIRRKAAEILKTKIPFYSWRFAVKPGITGWAQVYTGYGDSLNGQIDKLKYDLYYIQNQSVLLDLFILVKTVRSILYLKGK